MVEELANILQRLGTICDYCSSTAAQTSSSKVFQAIGWFHSNALRFLWIFQERRVYCLIRLKFTEYAIRHSWTFFERREGLLNQDQWLLLDMPCVKNNVNSAT